MKVKVTAQCMGDRHCNNICPDVFEYDEDELKSTVKFDEIPNEFKACAQQAAEECGAKAIEIVEE